MDHGSRKRIALFGGTFDPIHQGHVELIRSIEKSLLVDDIWVLPSPDPPHKQHSTFSPYHHRLQMIQLAIRELNLPAIICEVEKELAYPSYTIQTVRYLQEHYPTDRFYLCIGADSLNQFHTWKSHEELLQRVPLLVARRPGWARETVSKHVLNRTLMLDHPDVAISSRDLRTAISTGGTLQKPIQRQIPPSVWSYIQQEKLYHDA
ncbi:MAG: nicotinate (nicotinamide) nucleotide adenylyltransferase [Balneolaceae bacterium]